MLWVADVYALMISEGYLGLSQRQENFPDAQLQVGQVVPLGLQQLLNDLRSSAHLPVSLLFWVQVQRRGGRGGRHGLGCHFS